MKIGIITLYYNNTNYGGLLQAYALQKFMSENAYDCEQIKWDFQEAIRARSNLGTIKKSPNHTIRLRFLSVKNIQRKICKKVNTQHIATRKNFFKLFEEKVPHSDMKFNSLNFQEIPKYYDAVIVGSDQVWNMRWYCPEHFLPFNSDIIKIAYAASMPNVDLTDDQKDIVKEHLKSFSGISVREKNTVDFLNVVTNKRVCWMPDPVLLLERENWEKLMEPERYIKEPYIFCYWLGPGKNMRESAKKMAKKYNLKIVTLPHLSDIQLDDCFFGNIRLFDVSPERFLNLIFHAKYVLTDSFHATAFSIMFQTMFLSFARTENDEKSARLETLLSLFGLKNHLVSGGFTNVDYLSSLINESIGDYKNEYEQFRQLARNFFQKCCLTQ